MRKLKQPQNTKLEYIETECKSMRLAHVKLDLKDKDINA